MLQLHQILGVRSHKMSDGEKWVRSNIKFQQRAPVFPDELNTVVDKDKSDFAELCLLLCMQQRVVQGVAQLLQDWQENPVFVQKMGEENKEWKDQPIVQRQVAVSVAENQPAGKCCVCSCQLSLHGVLKHLQVNAILKKF